MLYPDDLLYTTKHVWVRLDEEKGAATVGITDDLQEELADILSIDMPLVGDELEMDTECLHFHLPADLRGVCAPLTGRVIEVNRDALDNAHMVHLAPYDSWLFRMEYDEPDEVEMLLSSSHYMRFIDTM